MFLSFVGPPSQTTDKYNHFMTNDTPLPRQNQGDTHTIVFQQLTQTACRQRGARKTRNSLADRYMHSAKLNQAYQDAGIKRESVAKSGGFAKFVEE